MLFISDIAQCFLNSINHSAFLLFLPKMKVFVTVFPFSPNSDQNSEFLYHVVGQVTKWVYQLTFFESLLQVYYYETLIFRVSQPIANQSMGLAGSLSSYCAISGKKPCIRISTSMPQIDSTNDLMLKGIYCSVRIKCQIFSVRCVVEYIIDWSLPPRLYRPQICLEWIKNGWAWRSDH